MSTSRVPAARATPGLPSGLTSKARRQRRWSLALVGVLLILGSALVFLLLFLNAGDRLPVLSVARNVPAGQVISADDLAVVRVGADAGVETISESERRNVIGQTAAVDLLPGTLLVAAQLGEPVALADGEAIVGVDLVGGEQAVPDLQEGDEVLVVLTTLTQAGATEDDTAAGSDLGEVITRARVSVVTGSEDDPDRVVVSLIVPEASAGQIAGANAANRIALVLVPNE
jgi:hypothetical protein